MDLLRIKDHLIKNSRGKITHDDPIDSTSAEITTTDMMKAILVMIDSSISWNSNEYFGRFLQYC